MRDTFFEQKTCDRCGNECITRIMSWFTKETICIDCSEKEGEIKTKLRAKGFIDAMEGCGYIPDPEKITATPEETLLQKFLEKCEGLIEPYNIKELKDFTETWIEFLKDCKKGYEVPE